MFSTVILLVFLVTQIISGYANVIDTESPIIIQDSASESRGNNLFGYSLAFLKGDFGGTSWKRTPPSLHGTLFIGAPKETRRSINSGVVWACKFPKDGSVKCSVLTALSNQASPPSCSRRYPISYPETERDQWIGASLTATKEHLYACAPRWKLNDFQHSYYGYYWGCYFRYPVTALTGACYKISGAKSSPTILGPFFEKGAKLIEKWHDYGQFGFSSHATLSNNVIFGLPSPTAAGGEDYIKGMLLIKCSVKGSYMEYLEGMGWMLEKRRDFEHHSYLGYSITSGRIMGGGEYVAVGAPRGLDLFGSVLINQFRNSGNNIMRVYGEQFGAYFGYALATADLNGDDKGDELIVGAPQFTMPVGFQTHDNYNGGCIFIYDVDVIFYIEKRKEMLCLDYETKGARFGSAIVNLGDINFDKKQDIAVAAPYHDNGIGTVFIYYGNVPFSTTPAQIINGKSFGIPNLRGFGTYLLSKNLDVDGNTTPDLAISSYESNHVVILRSRPVANPTLIVTFHSKGSLGNLGKIYSILPSSKVDGFRVRICIRFTFSVDILQQNFTLDSVIKYEVDQDAYFEDGNGYEMSYSFNIIEQTCLERNLKFSNDLLSGRKKLMHIEFRAGLSSNVSQNFTATLDVAKQPISSPAFAQAFRSFNPFLPASIPATYSRWERLEISNDNCEADGKPGCDPKLKLIVQLYFDDGQRHMQGLATNNSFLVGQVEAIVLKIWLLNSRETAYEPSLRVTLAFTDDFDLPKTDWQWRVMEDPGKIEYIKGNTKSSNGLLNVEDIVRRSRPLQNKSRIFYNLRISNLRQIRVRDHLEGKLHLKLEAFPENQRNEENVDKGLEILIKANLRVDITAVLPRTGDSEIDPKSRLVDLTQIYILNNTGVSSTSVDTIKVELTVPTHALVDEKVLRVFEVVNPSQFSFGLRCEAQNFSFFNPGTATDLLPIPESQHLRVKEKEKTGTAMQFPFNFTFDNFITMPGCNFGDSPICRKIICLTDLPSMESRTVQIQMYLLASTATMLISRDTAGIRVNTSISVHYLSRVVNCEGTTWRKFTMEKGIPMLIILLAAGGGIILFFLLSLILFKCGFFRRKAKEHLKTELKKNRSSLCPAITEVLPMQEIESGDNLQEVS